MPSVTETCPCGASFTMTATNAADVDTGTRRFREQHKHADSVGICGNRPSPLMCGDLELERPYCSLKAGHLGMHGSEDGSLWRYDDPQPAADPTGASGADAEEAE